MLDISVDLRAGGSSKKAKMIRGAGVGGELSNSQEKSFFNLPRYGILV